MPLFKRPSRSNRNETRVTDKVKTRSSKDDSGLLSFHAAGMQMVGTREYQEDSFAVINASDVTEIVKNGLFAIVADGMGGMQDGKRVSETAVAEFVTLFYGLNRSGDIPEQLQSGVYDVNKYLYTVFGGNGGTTAVMVMIYNGNLYWVSVGDSAIFLKRDGGLFLLNKEHTYMNQLYLEELESTTIDKERVQNDVDRARLSEFLGMDSLEEVDYNVRPLRLRNGDVLLLCSDGISGMLQEDEIINALTYSPPEACARLNDAIIRKQSRIQDNYTGLIIACKR